MVLLFSVFVAYMFSSELTPLNAVSLVSPIISLLNSYYLFKIFTWLSNRYIRYCISENASDFHPISSITQPVLIAVFPVVENGSATFFTA